MGLLERYYKESSAPLFLSPVTSAISDENSADDGDGEQHDTSIYERLATSGGIHEDKAENRAALEGFSPLLSLPLEILYQIIEIVYYDDNTTSINSNLENFLKTIPLLSKTLNTISLRFLYKYAIFNRPHSFDKFLQNVIKYPGLGQFVEFMDFQMFTSVGLGRTGRMNQEIQMVTSKTILQALSLTPNLVEFLASENIQDDLDEHVLNYLFNCLPKLQALDFCGASSESFVSAFHNLIIQPVSIADDLENLSNLFKISFHDCSSLTPDIFTKVLSPLYNLRRLDLTHTSITSLILKTCLPRTARLTHLSLAKCSKLTTKDLINFLTTHPAVANDLLQWLSLQIDANMVTPLNEVYLFYTIKHLKALNLKYLNLGGLPVNLRVLKLIKNQFPVLESLSISHSSVEMSDIMEYLDSNTQIKFLDISGCKRISKFNLSTILKRNYGSQLRAVEFDYKSLYELTAGDSTKITQSLNSASTVNLLSYQSTLPEIWKFYDNEGRRAWIYKIAPTDPEYESTSSKKTPSSNLTFYDLETGEKIVQRVKKPLFLKYASRKINCSIGYFNLNTVKKKKYLQNELRESVWPDEFSERGIYNYYSLNVK